MWGRISWSLLMMVVVTTKVSADSDSILAAMDNCGEYIFFNNDTPYQVRWNGEEGTCEVKFANAMDDNIICVTAYEYTVMDCGFELRFTEGMAVIPEKTFTCDYNTTNVSFCSKEGRDVNIEFATSRPSTSRVVLGVKQTKSVQRSNPFMGPLLGRFIVAGFVVLVISMSSVVAYINRRRIFLKRDNTLVYEQTTSLVQNIYPPSSAAAQSKETMVTMPLQEATPSTADAQWKETLVIMPLQEATPSTATIQWKETMVMILMQEAHPSTAPVQWKETMVMIPMQKAPPSTAAVQWKETMVMIPMREAPPSTAASQWKQAMVMIPMRETDDDNGKRSLAPPSYSEAVYGDTENTANVN